LGSTLQQVMFMRWRL